MSVTTSKVVAGPLRMFTSAVARAGAAAAVADRVASTLVHSKRRVKLIAVLLGSFIQSGSRFTRPKRIFNLPGAAARLEGIRCGRQVCGLEAVRKRLYPGATPTDRGQHAAAPQARHEF